MFIMYVAVYCSLCVTGDQLRWPAGLLVARLTVGFTVWQINLPTYLNGVHFCDVVRAYSLARLSFAYLSLSRRCSQRPDLTAESEPLKASLRPCQKRAPRLLLEKQACVQPPPSALNVTLTAFAAPTARHQQLLVDIFCLQRTQQLTRRPLLSIDGTDRQTDGRSSVT